MSGRRVSRRGHSSASSLPTAKELSELDKLRQSEVVMKARIRTVLHTCIIYCSMSLHACRLVPKPFPCFQCAVALKRGSSLGDKASMHRFDLYFNLEL